VTSVIEAGGVQFCHFRNTVHFELVE
jgi:hypothetical protein